MYSNVTRYCRGHMSHDHCFIQTAALLSNTVTIIAQMPGIRIILDDITLRFTATDSIQILFS